MNTVEAIIILRDAAAAHLEELKGEDTFLTPNLEDQIEALEFALAIVDKEMGTHYKGK